MGRRYTFTEDISDCTLEGLDGSPSSSLPTLDKLLLLAPKSLEVDRPDRCVNLTFLRGFVILYRNVGKLQD